VSWIQALVACSDAKKQAALLNLLVQSGLDPMVASNVDEVRAVLEQRPVHVVFCEDNLPEGGFREVLRLTKATGLGTQVVVASLLGELEEYLAAMQLGAFDFIAPPYRGADVIAIVDSVGQQFVTQVNGDQTMYYVYAGEAPAKEKVVA
jgi:DNA-binding NtrC family response regulator